MKEFLKWLFRPLGGYQYVTAEQLEDYRVWNQEIQNKFNKMVQQFEEVLGPIPKPVEKPKLTLRKCWKHFKLICIHKWWVFYYSRYLGMPVRGFFHDFSKFSPIEFFESARYYTGTSSPINEAKKIQGISFAWQHHKGRNPHHYEYWTDKYEEGTIPLKMPIKYVLELVCDYLAAGRTYNPDDSFTTKKELEWWNGHKNKKIIHPETKQLISAIFELIVERGLSLGYFSTRKDINSMIELKFSNYERN